MRDSDRQPELDLSTLTERQREVYDAIASGPRGQVVGPLRVWLASPELAETAQALGAFVRYGTRLGPQLSELAILVTARLWSSGFEWSHHAPIALAAGVPPDAIDAVSKGKRPDFDNAAMFSVFDVAVELHRDRQVCDETFTAAREALGQEGLVELVGLCGYYTLISMTINAFHVPDGEGPVLPDLGIPPHEMFRT